MSAGFSAARVYLYDTAGNFRYYDLNSLSAGISTGNTKGYSMTSGGTTGGTAPDVNAIDRIQWFLVSANTTAYSLNIDTLNANGAMEEGTSGAIAQAVSFSGNDHYLVTAGQNIDTANGLSLSAWVRPRDRQVYGQTSSIVSFGGGNWSTYYQTLLGYYDSEKVIGSSLVSATYDPPYPDGVSLSGQGAGLTTGAWHHVAGVYRYDSEASNSTVKVYVDGVLRVDMSGPGRALRPLLARPVCVGAKTQTAYPTVEPQMHIRGDLDEVRVSNVCRSEAWLKACYRNQKADGALLSLADMESKETWLPGWKRRHRLTLNHAAVDADLTNFPVLVRLTSDTFDFTHAAPDGADIRFMTGDGKALLPFEREGHDAAARTAAYWVRVPLVSASSNTTFYLYCGKSGVTDGATPAAVWDASHVGVWHLQQTNGVTQADSTAKGNALAVGPAGLDNGDAAISGCDSTADWSATGAAATLSVDTATRDTIGGSASSVKLAVASTAAGQTNTLVYNPAAPLVLGNRRLDFYYWISKSISPGFSKAFVYLYDTNGNYRSHSLTAGSGTDNTKGFGIASGGTTGGSAPDVNAIDRIE